MRAATARPAPSECSLGPCRSLHRHACRHVCRHVYRHAFDMCHAPLESSCRGGHFEYRHVHSRTVDMPSAMPIQSVLHCLVDVATARQAPSECSFGPCSSARICQYACQYTCLDPMPVKMPTPTSTHMPVHMPVHTCLHMSVHMPVLMPMCIPAQISVRITCLYTRM